MAERPDQRRIAVAHPAFWGNEKKYVQECVDTSWISSVGRFIPAFERTFAEFCDVEHAVSCDTGTSALHLALLGYGVGPGDEVIVPSLTFVATANAVRYCGAEPVFVDSEPRTMNLDPELLEAAITPKTRAVIVVHLFGHPCDMDPINAVAAKHNLVVIEDAAEAHGATYHGRVTGGLADAATFSFFGNKIVSTGEGGMITTSNADLADRIRMFRGQGMDPARRYWFPVVGYNYRMTNIQAAIGLAQMENVKDHVEARFRVAAWYSRYLQAHLGFLELPREETWARHAYWMFTIVLSPSLAHHRDQIMERMSAEGIETRPFFYPLHTLPPYRSAAVHLPVAEQLSAAGIMLPTHALLTEEDVARVSASLGEACRQFSLRDLEPAGQKTFSAMTD